MNAAFEFSVSFQYHELMNRRHFTTINSKVLFKIHSFSVKGVLRCAGFLFRTSYIHEVMSVPLTTFSVCFIYLFSIITEQEKTDIDHNYRS